jgi:hypothetical protein
MNTRKFVHATIAVLSLAFGAALLTLPFQKPSLAAQTPVASQPVDVAPVIVEGDARTIELAEMVIEAAPSSTIARKAPRQVKAPVKVVSQSAVLRELEQSTGVPERHFSNSKLSMGGESVLYFPNGAP